MKIIRNYFDFTKGERNAAILLLTLTLIVAISPYVYQPKRTETTDFSAFLAELKKDSANSRKTHLEEWLNPEIRPLFKFDPNTADRQTLESLGFKPFMAKRIEKFRNAGGKFKVKSDLYKLYGIDTVMVKSLLPFVLLPDKTTTKYDENISPSSKRKRDYEPIEINSADTNALIRLPGIGSKLANRIISFREKLGGFYTLDQLKEVYGLKPETIEQILSKLSLDAGMIKSININQAEEKMLSPHPYIGYKAAKTIVNYRLLHGDFKSMDDLKKVLVINEANLQKLKNYIKFN